jgi:hypothetical protein
MLMGLNGSLEAKKRGVGEVREDEAAYGLGSPEVLGV